MPNCNPITRRDLIRTSTVAMTAASYGRILGANDAIRIGVAALGLRGKQGLATFVPNSDVRLAALCDVWGDRVEEGVKRVQASSGVMRFSDHRQMLDKGQLDGVVVATTDHWHCAICVDAMNAGKDVYCEKPLTLSIEEGPVMVRAARENNRICQVGPRRSREMTHLCSFRVAHAENRFCHVAWRGAGDIIRAAGA